MADKEDREDKKTKLVDKWKSKIEAAGKFEKKWRMEARACANMYVNKSSDSSGVATMFGNTLNTVGKGQTQPQNNIFYSNVSFGRSSILTKMPEIIIRQRYSKQNSDSESQRTAYASIADIVQRSATVLVDTNLNYKELYKFKNDALITGRGILWILFESIENPLTGEVENENIKFKRIGPADFRISPCREWEEVSWIARRILLDKKTIEQQYGKEVAEKISLTYPNEEDKLEISESGVSFDPRAEVWEIWDKTTKEVVFICSGYDEVLARLPDPYSLEGFFPTPEPFLTVPKNDSLVPTPEFNLYRTEALEIGRISRRITNLISNLKTRGFVPNTVVKDMKTFLDAKDDGFILLDGVDSRALLEKGVDNVIQYEPIQQRAAVIEALANQVDRQKQTIYEITGLSDAMQITNALETSGGDAETATKTIMKGKFGSIRLQEKQSSFNEYMKELFFIVCEFICSKFSMATLQEITEITLNDGSNPEDQRISWEEAITYIRNDKMKDYLLDVETDMNVWESDAEAQQTRAQMVEMFTDQLSKVQDLAKNTPAAIDFYVKSFEFVLNSYQMPSSLRNNLEDVLNKIGAEIQQKIEQDKQNPPQPSGEEILAQAEKTKAEAMVKDVEQKGQIAQGELQIKAQNIQAQIQLANSRSQDVLVDADIRGSQVELQRYKIQTDYEIEILRLELEMKKLEIDKQDSSEAEQMKMASIEEKLQTKRQQLEIDHEHKIRKLNQEKEIAEATLQQKTFNEQAKYETQENIAKMKTQEKKQQDFMGGLFNGR